MATASDTAAPVADPVGVAGGEPAVATLAVAGWDHGLDEPSKSDRYLARRLAAASADYKGVALTTFLLGAAVAGGAWLAVGILAEHWAVPGGLSPAVRWAWLAAAVGALVVAAVRWLVPLVRYRVNLVYAARAIEREHPELHNDLVNTVLVKAHPDANAVKVVQSLERRTAKRLAEVPVEAVIDRTVPLRLAWVLAALVGLAGLYEVAAPKSLLVSAARLLAPWVGWAAPSRVRIAAPRLAWRMPAEDNAAATDLDRRRIVVEAGGATLVRGRQLVVAADIRGLRTGEKPLVVVAPLRGDGAVDPAAPAWRTEMTRGQAAVGAERMFAALLPDATRGLDQSIEITIAAGDARSGPVRVAVVDSPALLVRELRYAFPAYTRRAAETVAWQGDIRAVEGTEVTVVAEGNQPLEDAWIDFEGDGSRDLRFTKSAVGVARVMKSFRLRFAADGTRPEHESYRLLFQPVAVAGASREQVIVDALEHRIEVVADVAPEVAIEEPRESPLRVPPAAPVTVRVQAHDPDFALASVGIETRLQGGAAGPQIVLLEREHSGMFRGTAQIVPERVGAGAGTTLEYRAVAVDNRPKRPNVSHSPWQSLRIDPAAPPRQPEQTPSGRQRPDDSPAQGQQRPGKGADAEKTARGDGSDGGRQGMPQDEQAEDVRAQEKNEPAQQPQNEQSSGKQDQGKQDQGKQGQAAEGQEGDGQQQSADGKPAGKSQAQRQNQGEAKGAEQAQGAGAEGQREGSAEQQSGGQQPGGAREAGGASESRRANARDNAVAADGTNDGEAIERILDHRREQGEDQGQGKEGQGKEGQGKEGQGKEGQGKEGQGKEGQGKEGRAEGAGQAPRDRQDGSRKPGAEGEHEHAPCAGADGKPCGKQGCPTCKGQGSGGQSGGGDGQPGNEQKDPQQDSGAGGAGDKPGEAAAKPGTQPSAGSGQQGAGGEPSDAGGAEAKEQTGGKDGASGGEKDGAGSSKEQGSSEGQGSVKEQGNAGKGPGAEPRPQATNERSQGAPDKQDPPASDQPGSGSGQAGNGGWAGGDATKRGDGAGAPDGPSPSKQTEWGEQDLAHARNAADLAIEHLRKAVESGDAGVLDRLGWTRDEARAFLDRWEKMRRLAASGDPAKRGEFERAMRSLGLRPDGVRNTRDVPSDVRGGQAEGRRSRPPADYQEQFKAYTQGTSGE